MKGVFSKELIKKLFKSLELLERKKFLINSKRDPKQVFKTNKIIFTSYWRDWVQLYILSFVDIQTVD